MTSESVGLAPVGSEGSQPLPAHRAWYDAQRPAGMTGMEAGGTGSIPPEDMEMFFPSIDGSGSRGRYYGASHSAAAYPAHTADWSCKYPGMCRGPGTAYSHRTANGAYTAIEHTVANRGAGTAQGNPRNPGQCLLA